MPRDAPERYVVSTTTNSTDTTGCLSLAEAARYLAIGERTLRREVADGRVPHVRLGRRIVFPKRQLDDWLATRAEKSMRRR